MLLELAGLAPRARHLLSILFTEWTAVGLGVALVVWVLAGRLTARAAREGLLLVASVAILVWFASVGVAAGWLVYALAFYAAVELLRPRWLAAAVVIALLAAQVVVPIVAGGALGEQGRRAREFTAFASNMAFLRFHAYVWDRWRRDAERLPVGRFLLAMLFFPTFVNGPIEPPKQWTDGWRPHEARSLGVGLGRVLGGVAKLAFVGLVFEPGWTRVLAEGPHAPARSIWIWGMLLYAWFYLSFSAWSDVAVGLSTLVGRRVPENFDRPWLATDPADFWRRWHVSFGVWLRDYVYIPLGGNRRHRALNVVVTFVVSAAWHVWGSVKLLGLGYFPPAAWGGFLLWGLLNAIGVLASRPLDRVLPVTGTGTRIARSVAAFLFAALCWIPFFLPSSVSLGSGLTMLLRMVWPF